MKHSSWWLFSGITSIVLIIILLALWSQMNSYQVEPTQLVDYQSAEKYLKTHWNSHENKRDKSQTPIEVKTGIFIQSLQFSNSTEVSLTGYIWQRYQDGVHDAIKPSHKEVGFIFPEQVNSGADIEPREVYRYREENEEVIGWYFEATLRQQFDYSDYPFDHKTVWIRMWPKDFFRDIILIPDFAAYESTGIEDTFGVEDSIVLGTWERQNTYFDYKLASYTSNFGITSYVGQTGFPELHFNIVVKRKFENAFIVHLLPLFLVAALLFASLLTISNHENLSMRFGFSTTGFIGACSALFFVVLLAHIQLREKFAESSIVYIEYFYVLMYVLLILATINTYLFSIHADRWSNFIVYKDNILPKVAYWPVLISSMIFITCVFL